MYVCLRELLSDKKGEAIFTCFGIWHLLIIMLFAGITVTVSFYLKDKSRDRRKKLIDLIIALSFGLYIADFFLMPFAYGEIDIEKLPFHACTAMCVLCFVSRYNRFFGKFKLQLAALGFISNLVYLIYPAGVMWYEVSPLSYRVIQTLSFHGLMAVYGFLVLCFEGEFRWNRFYRDLIVTASMTIWALIGNYAYNSDSRVYNWFFVIRDPFYVLDADISVFVMPLINVALFLTAELMVYFAFAGMKYLRRGQNRICSN